MSNRAKGFICAITVAVIFGCMPLFAKIIYSYGGNSPSLVFYRNFFALPFLYYLAFCGKDGKKYRPSPVEWRKLILLVAGGMALTPILLFESYQYIPSGMATTIHFIYPVFVLLGAFIFYRQAISRVQIICVILCTLGVMLFYTPGDSGSLLGTLLAFLSGIAYAFYTVYLDRSGLIAIPKYVLLFYSILLCSIMTFFYALLQGLTYQFPVGIWLLIIVFSVLVSVCGIQCFQLAVKYIGAPQTSILNTFEPITSIILGILCFHESLSVQTAIGMVLVLSAVSALTLFDK